MDRRHFDAPRDPLKQIAELGTYVLHLGIPRTSRLTHARAHGTVRAGLKKQGIQVPHSRSTRGSFPVARAGVLSQNEIKRGVNHDQKTF